MPSGSLSQHLPSYLGFSYLGPGVSLHGCSSKVQPLLLTLDEGYLLMAAPPDLERGVVPLSPPAPAQPPLLGWKKAFLSNQCKEIEENNRMGKTRDLFKEKAKAPHSSTLAWRILWMEELGGLQSMGRKELDTTERLHFHFHFTFKKIRDTKGTFHAQMGSIKEEMVWT